MTDEQYKSLRAIQFAQLALLQSIDANIRWIARQQKPPADIGVNWNQARVLVNSVMGRQRGGKARRGSAT
jgi:hypothetical protein